MQITIPDTSTVPLGRNALYGTLDVDLAKFPPHIHDYIFTYGLRHALNDAMANKKDENGADLPHDQIKAKAEKRLAAMYAGELRQRGEGAEPADPIEAEAHKLAKQHLIATFTGTEAWKAASGKAGVRLLNVINTNRAAKKAQEFDTLAEALEMFLAHPSNAQFRKTAERNVKEMAQLSKSLNPDDMGL